MTGSEIHANEEGSCVRPFLMRFARECTAKDRTRGDRRRPPHTYVTDVRRETTDER